MVHAMTRLVPVLLAGAAVLAAGGCRERPDEFSDDDDTVDDDDWGPRFDPLVDAIEADLAASSTATGVSVAVLENGEITFAAGFGSAHPEHQVEVTPTTLFQIGSTTKMMTATALLQRVEAGQLSVDDTLDQVLPELVFAYDPSWTGQITVHDLLSQQSGLADWAPWDASSDDADLAEYAYGYYAAHLWAMNPPGVFWNYSNPNFSLAGLITEELDTRYWPDIVTEDVLEPLGMDRTYARKEAVAADGDYAVGFGYDVSAGYAWRTVEFEDEQDAAFVRPAGLVWSTPSQMVRFAEFLMHGDEGVLGAAMHDELVAEQVNTLSYEDVLSYGYGVFLWDGYLTMGGDYYPTPVYEHGGNTMTMTSILYALPEYDFAISILSNGYGTAFYGALDAAVTTLLDLGDPVPAPEYSWDPDRLDLHVGDYMDLYNVGEIIISRNGDALQIEMPLLEQYGYTVQPDLIPVSSDIHYAIIDGSYVDLTFVAEIEGEPSTYVKNRSFVGTRVAEGERDAAGPARTPDPEDVARALEQWRRPAPPLTPAAPRSPAGARAAPR